MSRIRLNQLDALLRDRFPHHSILVEPLIGVWCAFVFLPADDGSRRTLNIPGHGFVVTSGDTPNKALSALNALVTEITTAERAAAAAIAARVTL